MRVVIIANSPNKSFKKIYEQNESDYIITTDAGIKEALILNRLVDLALGDFDSGGIELAQKRSAEVKEFEIMKNETDLELALMEVEKQKDVTEIIIYDALHGRLDHLLTNFKIIAKFTKKYHLPIYLVDEKHRISYLETGTYEISKAGFEHLSFINFESVEISLEGVLYPLDHAYLQIDDTYTVSNKIVGDKCQIKISKGSVFCLQVSERGNK